MRTELAQAVSAAPAADLPNPTEFDAALDEEEGAGRGDDYYASLEQQRQTELMHEQDEQLDGVFRTVGNLRQQANDMGRELEDQAVMIDEVDTLADRVGGKLNNGMARIRHIVRKNEGKQDLTQKVLFPVRPVGLGRCCACWVYLICSRIAALSGASGRTRSSASKGRARIK